MSMETEPVEAPRERLGGRSGPGLAPVVIAAWAAVLGFRVGVLPGGLVGVDVALAASGWWLASGGAGYRPLRRRVALVWSILWRPVLVALALAIGWVLLEDSTASDTLVRGEGLAMIGGYANWHQLSLGPLEAAASRVDAPLQHMWALAVLVQCLVVWLLVIAITRGRAARRPDSVDPSAPLGLGVALTGAAVGAALAFGGASGEAVLLATPVRVVPFLLAAAAAAGASSAMALDMRALAARIWPVAGGVLVLLSVTAAPGTDLGRWSSALLAPLLAVLVVLGVSAPAPVEEELVDVVPAWPWSVLVASWVLLTPCLAIARSLVGDSVIAWAVVGLALGAVVVAAVVSVETRASMMPAAVERRRTLAPPIAVALVVLLLSVTGAFHWEGPQSRPDWERTHQR